MLYMEIPESRLFDDETSTFIYVKKTKLQMEHSLVSVAKWEAKWKKSFIFEKDKTVEEWMDYFKCMTITQNVDPNVYLCFSEEDYKTICSYIEDPMTATTFGNEQKGRGTKRRITAEEIYFEMFQYNIPVEFQKWHFNRLMALIRVCQIKMKSNSKSKKSKESIAKDYARLNEERMRKFNSKG